MAADKDPYRLSAPHIFLVRMVVFLVLCGFVAFILYRQILVAFMANPGLNGLILGVLFIGVVLSLRQVGRLIPERGRERAEVRNGRLVRRFRTSGEATVWFAIPAAGGVTATGGTREGSYFKFSGASAREFTSIMPLPAAPAP